MVSSETVYFHLRAANSIGEVVEGIPTVGFEVVANIWSSMESSARQAYS